MKKEIKDFIEEWGMDDVEGFNDGMKMSLQNILSNACLKQREICSNNAFASDSIRYLEGDDAIQLRKEMLECKSPKGL